MHRAAPALLLTGLLALTPTAASAANGAANGAAATGGAPSSRAAADPITVEIRHHGGAYDGDAYGDDAYDEDDFPETIALPPGSQPEGITSGPGTTFYAGARADGAIFRGDLRTGQGAILVPGQPGRVAVGMEYDELSGRLWVAGGTTGAVTAYDARTGRELARYVVPGDRFLNDVTVTRNGVYVTDSRSADLVVIPARPRRALPAADSYRLLRLTGDFQVAAGFNANGIRVLPDGYLVIVQAGKLFRVDPRTGVADQIELTGPALTAGDGLELRGRTLFVVYGFGTNEVAVVRLSRDLRNGQVTGRLFDTDLDRPTTATLVAGRLWVVNGRFSTPATPTTPYSVVQLELP